MSPKTMRLLAKPMLFAAAIIWGTSFFIMKNALDAVPVFFLLARIRPLWVRAALGVLSGLALCAYGTLYMQGQAIM